VACSNELLRDRAHRRLLVISTSATAAPAAANASAVARPMPEPAPVTSATLFSNDKFTT
jgi:hypothetical protein